jgi:hypothetical protein
METMTETGTEKRVDELSKRVDFGFEEMSKRVEFGFEQTTKRMDLGFALLAKGSDDLRSEMHKNFARVDDDVRELRSELKTGFDSLHQLIIRVCAGTIGSIVAGVVVLLLSHS